MYDQSNVERTLYGFWLSPYMSQVAHLLSETGLTYRYERVSPFQGARSRQSTYNETRLGKFPPSGMSMGLIFRKVTQSVVISRESTRKHESFILLMIRCSVQRSMPRMTSSLSPLRVHSSTGLLSAHIFQKHGNSKLKKKRIFIICFLSC